VSSDPALIQLEDSLEAINDYFCQKGWSDGLPIVPPTPERVDQMLAWTDRDRGVEIGTMPPRQGIVTIEKLAVNAVMAGCRPEYFPVVVAATEAMLDERFNLRAVQCTTHPCAPLLILNGPIARELDVNSRYNAFGPGWRANATIGRAVRLILLNVGGGTPGVLDRATQGQPAKYSYCIAEDEVENPWSPLHVERGFDRATSTVTVCGAENPHNLNDHVSIGSRGILTTIASSMASMGSNNAYLYGEPILALGPEHAAILARDGLSKDDIRRDLWHRARIPREQWESGGMFGMSSAAEDRLPGEPALPIFFEPDDLMILVVGGAGRHSCWMPTFGAWSKSVTRPIALKDGAPAQTIDDFRRHSATQS
jgi:hypothetical protein